MEQVPVIPQVVGTLVNLSLETGLRAQQDLVIDVRYGTLVWRVAHVFSANPVRSGGNMGGVLTLLEKVARAIDQSAASNVNILNRFDQALLKHSPSIKVHGDDVLLANTRTCCPHGRGKSRRNATRTW